MIERSGGNQQEDVDTVVVPNVLLVKDDMDGNTACVLTKALFDHRAELVKVNRAADGISLETARQTSPVPLHPGAADWYVSSKP